ncbi:AAA family ATPase, partial [Escherichia coli]|uniref:AAA family ATPase n=1 Tax=Escherichia coli TaxID=562 RepID=UPI003EE2D3A9
FGNRCCLQGFPFHIVVFHSDDVWLDNNYRRILAVDTFSQVAATPRTAGTTDKTSLSEEENMLLKKQVLFPATKKAFGLFRDPFADEAMQGSDDVFTTPDIRYVREALYQTARHGGFMAVIGESGAGKSTLRRDLTERINRENAPVIVIEPYIIAMEDNDVKGKTLKAAAIAEA